MFVCKIFGDRVDIYEADVKEHPHWWDVQRNGMSTRLYKNENRIIVGTRQEIAEKLESMVRKRRKALEELIAVADRDIGRCHDLGAGITCITTRPIREEFEDLI